MDIAIPLFEGITALDARMRARMERDEAAALRPTA